MRFSQKIVFGYDGREQRPPENKRAPNRVRPEVRLVRRMRMDRTLL